MGLIEHHNILWHGRHVAGFVAGELVGANNDVTALEWTDLTLSEGGIIGFGFEDAARKKKLSVSS